MGPNMKPDVRILEEHGIKPSAQRVAVAEYVLHTPEHPSAEKVWARVRERFPTISRATIYNTLNLFVAKGLLRTFQLGDAAAVFDANTDDHHHFIDVDTGEIHDVPWEAIEITGQPKFEGYDVLEYQVVMRGSKKRR